jgi:hypothetical protein
MEEMEKEIVLLVGNKKMEVVFLPMNVQKKLKGFGLIVSGLLTIILLLVQLQQDGVVQIGRIVNIQATE